LGFCGLAESQSANQNSNGKNSPIRCVQYASSPHASINIPAGTIKDCTIAPLSFTDIFWMLFFTIITSGGI